MNKFTKTLTYDSRDYIWVAWRDTLYLLSEWKIFSLNRDYLSEILLGIISMNLDFVSPINFFNFKEKYLQKH